MRYKVFSLSTNLLGERVGERGAFKFAFCPLPQPLPRERGRGA